ncbi:hypothetical protein [Pseudorhodoferax sp. Leaf274]|uniref:hypothetical protein n=1 Tax=Pseudorhodoferax sp. Leaf274 TaxID=1736318 RepID=UPI00070311BE|nr:hypothetical protein [Pseudorhodoferax sp. Leaf274]KQP35542.1 hypothetical protein ASF44_19630 [Pseudorhodoferax sp. Leaf274]
MPRPNHQRHHAPDDDVWSVEGRFQHLVYSPKGGIEGLLIDTDGIATQFTVDPHDAAAVGALLGLRHGQALAVEGRKTGPSPKGEGAHVVYRFERLAAIDGQEPEARNDVQAHGKVVRFNFAKHGAPNGVVLDSGDFVHTRPDGLERLRLQIGDAVRAEGPAHPLATGSGRVIEARSVNGQPLAPAH